MASPTAVHRTILVADVEGFGDRRRTMHHQLAVREGLYRALRQAFAKAGIPWTDCDHEDRGDGVFVLAPAHLPKAPFADSIPPALVAALYEHNSGHPAEERIRLRLALHAGEVAYDEHGVTATSINLAFRLLDAPALRTALAESPGVLAVITSGWFFDEVVRHSKDTDPATFRPVRVTVKETSTVGWVGLPDHPYPSIPGDPAIPPAPSPEPVPRQLPGAPRAFTGRAGELAALTVALGDRAGRGAPVAISAITGAGGIGKTTLALYWAHQHADRFPDGQLFVDLRGFGPGGQPISPATAVGGFLEALGVSPARLPVDLDARAALYRSLVAGRRMLIVLDNARSAGQVVPLLPGSPTCAVLITSRHRLTSLVTAHGARPLPVDVLSEPEARAFLTARLGPERPAAEPGAVRELLTYCAGLPLALSVLAGRAESLPGFPLSALAAELRDTATRLDTLADDDPAASLPAVLSWSVHALPADQARLLGLLGAAAGPDIAVPAAARLAGAPIDRVRGWLRGLEQAHLVQPHVPGRYRMHDLVKLYAAGQAGPDAPAALRRLVDHYIHTAHAHDRLLAPHRPPIRIGPATAGPAADTATALAWFDTEHANLLAAQEFAVTEGRHAQVWQLAWVLDSYHWHRGHLRENLTTWRSGLAAADTLGDPATRTLAHLCLSQACFRVKEQDQAQHHLDQAMALAERTGDVAGQADTLRALAFLWGLRGEFEQALAHAGRALRLFQALGEPPRECEALSAVGWFHACCGHAEEARDCAERALVQARREGDRIAESTALCTLGMIAHQAGEYDVAQEYCYRALPLYRELGHVYYEAELLDHIGQTHLLLGEHQQGHALLTQALALYRSQHRTDDADRLRRQLPTLPANPDY